MGTESHGDWKTGLASGGQPGTIFPLIPVEKHFDLFRVRRSWSREGNAMTLRIATVIVLISIFSSVTPITMAKTPQAANHTEQQPRPTKTIREATALLDSWSGQEAVLIRAKGKLDAELRVNPNSAWAYREYARYFIMSGATVDGNVLPEYLAQADRALQKALTLKPNFAEAYLLEGHLYRLMGRLADAKAALEKAQTLGTNDPWLQNNWGDILVEEGNFDEAAKRYNKVLNGSNRNEKAIGHAYEGIIDCYIKTGQTDKADRTYRRAIAHDPHRAWTHGNYAAFLLCTRDDYESSVVQARQALKLMDYDEGHAVLGAALYRKWSAQIANGQQAAAAATYAEGESIDPNPPVVVVASMCGTGPALSAVLSATHTYH